MTITPVPLDPGRNPSPLRARSPNTVHRHLFDGPPMMDGPPQPGGPPIDIHEWKQLEAQVSQLTSLALRVRITHQFPLLSFE